MINKRVFLMLSAILVISIFSSPAQALWLSGYEYRKEITIDHTKIGSDLSNFPLAVILSDTTNIVDGNDVKFTLADGETKLDYEKEKYATDDAAYWVNIPSVSSGTDTTFYMYYGKTGDTDESTSDIWDSDYKMVQHLEETSGTHYDSTAYSNNANPSGGVTQNAAGQIDGADYFDGSNDYLNCGDSTSLNVMSGAFTLEAWVNPSATTGTYDPYVGTLWGNGIHRVSSDKVLFLVWYGPGDMVGIYSDSAIPDNEWSYIVGLRDSSNVFRLYINGVEQTQTDIDGRTPGTNKVNRIGADDGNNHYNHGFIDEVRISNTGRSADWILASYYSGNSTLLSYGSEETEVIPEPTSFLLLGFGVVGIAVFRKKL